MPGVGRPPPATMRSYGGADCGSALHPQQHLVTPELPKKEARGSLGTITPSCACTKLRMRHHPSLLLATHPFARAARHCLQAGWRPSGLGNHRRGRHSPPHLPGIQVFQGSSGKNPRAAWLLGRGPRVLCTPGCQHPPLRRRQYRNAHVPEAGLPSASLPGNKFLARRAGRWVALKGIRDRSPRRRKVFVCRRCSAEREGGQENGRNCTSHLRELGGPCRPLTFPQSRTLQHPHPKDVGHPNTRPCREGVRPQTLFKK